MTPRQRSLAGAALAVLAIPAVLGILACLPVPIGDPEKSRIDADVTGIWLKWDDEPAAALFEPYDKRTWLLTLYELEFVACPVVDRDAGEPAADGFDVVDLPEPPAYADLVAALRHPDVGCLEQTPGAGYKTWLTRLGDTEFMTLEMKGAFDADHGFYPGLWLVFRFERVGADAFRLWMIDPDFEPLKALEDDKAVARLLDEEVPSTPRVLKAARRAYEKVIRREAGNPEMYADQPARYFRIQPDDYELFLDEVIPSQND